LNFLILSPTTCARTARTLLHGVKKYILIYNATFTKDESTNANCCLSLKSHFLHTDEMIKYRKVFFLFATLFLPHCLERKITNFYDFSAIGDGMRCEDFSDVKGNFMQTTLLHIFFI
jgi:hypothetical protein